MMRRVIVGSVIGAGLALFLIAPTFLVDCDARLLFDIFCWVFA